MIKKLTAVSFSVVLTLVLLEVGLYAIGYGDPILYKTDGPFMYRLLPDQEKRMIGPTVRINSVGMRGQEPIDGQQKIVFFGDSITYGGNGLPDAAIFVHLINKNHSVLGHEALNAGVNGYGPENIKELFVFYKDKLDLQKVVLVIPSIDLKRPLKKSGFVDLYNENDLFIGRSHMFFKLAVHHSNNLLKRAFTDVKPDDSQNADDERARYSEHVVRSNIESYTFVIEHSSKVIVFFVPSRDENSDGAHVNELKNRFISSLSTINVDVLVVDLADSLRPYGATIYRDSVHFNEAGHEVLAKLMLPHFNAHFTAPH